MSFPGNGGLDPAAADALLKSAVAGPKAKDALRIPRANYLKNPGYWPSGRAIVRATLLLVGVVILTGWLLTALNS